LVAVFPFYKPKYVLLFVYW